MDKLTWYDEDGQLYCRRGYEVALARLASYEATGLTPEEINDLSSVREISPEAEYAINKHADSIIERLDKLLTQTDDDARLRKLAKADKEGRIVVLPCKSGDTVYTSMTKEFMSELFPAPQKGVCEYFCYGLELDGFEADGWYAYLKLENGKSYTRYPYAFSEVRTTFEEAEKALEARKDETS